MINYWLHRINWEWQLSYPLLKIGYMSIGFGDFGTKELLDKLNDDFEGTIEAEWGGYGVNRFCLKNFIQKMKAGDYVIIPKWNEFDIYQIEGNTVITAEEILSEIVDGQTHKGVFDKYGNEVTLNKDGYLVAGDRVIDLGFFWKVKPVMHGLIRKDYDGICSSLRYRRTNLQLIDKAVIAEIKKLIPQESAKLETDSFDESELDLIAADIEKVSVVKQVVKYLNSIKAEVVISVDGEDSEFCKNNNIDVYAEFKEIDSSIYVIIQKEDSNVKDWIKEQVAEFRKLHSNGEDSTLLWLISNRGYFQESVKKNAGIGLKLSATKEIEELYLNNIKNNKGNAYSEILEDLEKKINTEYEGKLKKEEKVSFDRSHLLICKMGDKTKDVVILPVIFELQNVKYIKKHFREYLQLRGNSVGIIVFGDSENGITYIVYDALSKDEYVTTKKDDVLNIIDEKDNIEELTLKQQRKCIVDNLSFMKDDKILEKLKYYKQNKKWGFKDGNDENVFWHKLLDNSRISNNNVEVHNKATDMVCRYTTLQSLFLMLDNKTYRMQGLVGMNDISEVDYVDEYCGLESNQNDANNIFITSCSSSKLEDDLTMWRLYGDEARGVCLVFKVSKDIPEEFTFQKVEYVDNIGVDYRLEIVKRLIGCGFSFSQINKWKHFFKAAEYKIEEEVRLLFERSSQDLKWNKTANSHIINPSVDFDLNKKFPLQLYKIILGPKCPEKYVNTEQIKALIRDKKLLNGSNITVTTSRIDNYR